MWSLRFNEEDEYFYLTFDRDRPRLRHPRLGQWILIGQQGSPNISSLIRINKEAGHLVAEDDEGGVRMLVLTE